MSDKKSIVLKDPCNKIVKKREEKFSEVKKRCRDIEGCKWNNQKKKCLRDNSSSSSGSSGSDSDESFDYLGPYPKNTEISSSESSEGENSPTELVNEKLIGLPKLPESVFSPKLPESGSSPSELKISSANDFNLSKLELIDDKSPNILKTLNQDGYQLFTFNDITKFYGSKIILDPSGNVSNYQWHTFQLLKIAEMYQSKTKDDITKCTLSRIQLINNINNKRKVIKTPTIAQNQSDLVKLGLIPKKDTINLINNLGGLPKQPLILNKYKTDVVFKKDNYYQYVSNKIRKPKSQPISQPIKPNPDCIKGVIKYHQNKCYMDTILQLLLVNTPENSMRKILLDSLNKNQQIFKSSTKEAKLSKQMKNLSKSLDDGKIINSRVIVNALRAFVPKTHHFVNNVPSDTNEFLMFLLDSLKIMTSSYNEVSYYYAKNKIDPGNSITTISNTTLGLQNIKSNFYGVKEKLFRKKSSTKISLLEPAISVVSLPIINDSNISDLLAWQEESGPLEKPPYYLILTNENWSYHINKDSVGEFYQLVDEKTKINQLILSPVKTPELELDRDNQLFKYKGETIASYGFRYKIDRFSVNQANVLIIPLNRQIFGVERDSIKTTSIIPEQMISLSGDELRLFNIICYGDGGVGHYFGYYLCNGLWYKYDDNATNNIILIGDYDTLISVEVEWVKKRSCTLFYSKF